MMSQKPNTNYFLTQLLFNFNTIIFDILFCHQFLLDPIGYQLRYISHIFEENLCGMEARMADGIPNHLHKPIVKITSRIFYDNFMIFFSKYIVVKQFGKIDV